MKTTPAEKHLINVMQNVKLPKSHINENCSLVGDIIDPKVLKKIAKELMKDHVD